MSQRLRYKALEAAQPHRVPRCKTCHLVLPCRNDGRFGPCDAREVTNGSHAAICALIAAIREGEARESDNDEHDDRADVVLAEPGDTGRGALVETEEEAP